MNNKFFLLKMEMIINNNLFNNTVIDFDTYLGVSDILNKKIGDISV